MQRSRLPSDARRSSGKQRFGLTRAPGRPGSTSFEPFKGTPPIAAMSFRTWQRRCAVADLQRSHGKYIYHGTDVHVVEAIVAQGLLPGGGPGGRRANHFVVGPMPTQWSEARGFRRGSNAVVQCNLEVLLRAGVRLFSGANGVLLADTVPTSAIFRILAADNQRGEYTEVLAEIGSDRRLNLVRDLRAEAVEAAAAAMGTSAAATGSADADTPAAPAERGG